MRKKTLLIAPESIKNGANIPLVTNACEDGHGLARRVAVDMDTIPEVAEREDALACGWLEISPYWKEPYVLIVGEDKILRYVEVVK